MTNERTYQVVIGVLLIIIIVGGVYAFRQKAPSSMQMTDDGSMASSSTQNDSGSIGNSNSTASSSSSTTAPSTNTMTASGDSVSVASQAAGMSVAVQSLTVGQSTWVAIRDSSGRTLGAALFPAGTQTDVSVPLLRATESGQSYQVMLYADSGDKTFDLQADQLIINDDGSVAGTTFTAN